MKHRSLRLSFVPPMMKLSYNRKRAIAMFSDNLRISILRLCEQQSLTYESAAEHCGISSRSFSNIVRGQTAPTIETLEKLCIGLNTTPNELLLPTKISETSQVK